MFLCEHLDSLAELAVLLWLARSRGSFVSSLSVAEQVGIDEEQAVEVLDYLVSIGLVEDHPEVGLYRYALEFPLPSGLARGLGARYGSRWPN